jgi:hypothetical protein
LFLTTANNYRGFGSWLGEYAGYSYLFDPRTGGPFWAWFGGLMGPIGTEIVYPEYLKVIYGIPDTRP